MSPQNEEELLPLRSKRKLAALFRQSPLLNQDKELQKRIIDWAKEMLAESRAEWNDIHTTAIDAVISNARKDEAQKRGKLRDKKYAPFREYFYNLQQQKFQEYQKAGQKLSANGFALWFLQNKPLDIDIPYKASNQQHKLIRLAEFVSSHCQS